MSAIINYEDICVPETRKATTVKGPIHTCFVKIGLFQTGNLRFMNDEVKTKIEECKTKNIALASVSFKMIETDWLGNKISLETQEQIAKDIVNKIRDFVVDRPLDTDSAHTVVPYFDIEFFAFYDAFLKDKNCELSGPELTRTKSNEDVLSPEELDFHKRRASMRLPEDNGHHRITVADVATRLIEIVNSHPETVILDKQPVSIDPKSAFDIDKSKIKKQPENNKDNSETSKVTEHESSVNIQKVDDKTNEPSSPKTLNTDLGTDLDKGLESPMLSHVLTADASTAHNSHQDHEGKFKYRTMVSCGNLEEIHHLERLEAQHINGARKNSQDDSQVNHKLDEEKPDQAGKNNLHLPRVLIRLGSSDNLEEIVGKERLLAHQPTINLIASPHNSKGVKAGLSFTTNTLGLLFRLTKTLEKRQKFKSHKIFDEKLDIICEAYGINKSYDTVLSILNQSLSSLGKYKDKRRSFFRFK